MAEKPRRSTSAPETPTLGPPQVARGPGVFFLRTKLLPPRPAPELLPRPRLTERLLANLESSVTLVTANAGSGKTTLVADFIRRHELSSVWYQLDHTDADPVVFLGYITTGIGLAVHGFGGATLAYLQQAGGELARHPERAVDVLLNEVLDRVERQLVLVLDDYHHLGEETAVHQVVDRLLHYLPDVLHVVIISRDVPPLSLARLRAQSSLAVIDRSELLFTDQETQELFRKVFDLELTPEQMAEYRERTHGWITALQLVRQVAQRKALSAPDGGRARPDLVEILRQSERDIFDYFAEEVFADEQPDVRDLLMRIALLERLDLETCSSLYPSRGCASLLPSLVRRNVFLTLAADARGEEYRLHPLFRDFLRRRYRSEVGAAGVADAHREYASFFLERGRWERATYHLLAAQDFDRAAQVLADTGASWISAGALGSLAAFASKLPQEALESQPRALLHRAEVARLQGEYETAQALLRRAAALLHDLEDREGEAEALHSLATIARRAAEFEQTFEYLDRAVELTDDPAIRMKCGNTRGLCLVSLGEWTAAEAQFRTALQTAEERGDERYARLIAHNLGLPAMMRGDFGAALRWLKRMFRDDGELPIPQEATGHLNVARCLFYRGDLAGCEWHLDRAAERCQLFNLAALRGELFEFYGNLARERGEAARAADYYERALRAYDAAGIEPTRREVIEEQAVLALQTGDPAGALARLDRLVAARQDAADELGAFVARLARSRVFLALGDHGAARADLEPALQYFRAHGLYYYEAQGSLALAQCAHAEGRDGETIERLRRALDLAARYDYEYWLQREVSARPELFAAPDAADLLPPELREQLPAAVEPGRVAALAQRVLVEARELGADLTINMLGPVEILRDPQKPLAPDAWTTKRARDILCFIASRRHRRAPKDVIIDTFWGEADFASVEKNFHPTVSHIRKALNSNQPLKQNFLVYRDGDYALNPEFSYRIDTEEFDRLLAEGEAARRARQADRMAASYETAIALYRGDFMPGCYDEWAEELRSYYREQYLHTLEELVGAAQKVQEWTRSLQLAQQILRDDPFREDIHCAVMRAYAALGNRVAVKEQYESLRAVLRKELGVEPVAETQRVYRELLK
jgi:ATP/maltotriose-dependent transcriptional regulator MalT/two-component SAPR family response regulator